MSGNGQVLVAGGVFDTVGADTVGSVFVWIRESPAAGAWGEFTPLRNPASTTNPRVGKSVHLDYSGSVLVVGNFHDSSNMGSVCVYERSSALSSFSFIQRFDPVSVSGTTPTAGQQTRVSANGQTIVWGAPGDNSATGAWYRLTRQFMDGEFQWIMSQTKYVPTGATSGGTFGGRCLAISADGHIMVGSQATESSTSSLYLIG
jgi:hypothetical protein